MPNKAKAFTVKSDASKFATGTVLQQADINGDMHPCGYLSQSLDTAQQNYEIYDRKLLEIVCALEEWRHYLEGNPFSVHVLSDHKNIEYFCTAQKLNRRQAQWSLFLSQFDLQLQHVSGTKMVQSDILSRLQHLNKEVNDNDDIVLLPDKMFISAMDVDLANQIQTSNATDKVVLDALAAAKSGDVLPIKSTLADWTFEDGLVFY